MYSEWCIKRGKNLRGKLEDSGRFGALTFEASEVKAYASWLGGTGPRGLFCTLQMVFGGGAIRVGQIRHAKYLIFLPISLSFSLTCFPPFYSLQGLISCVRHENTRKVNNNMTQEIHHAEDISKNFSFLWLQIYHFLWKTWLIRINHDFDNKKYL